MKSLHVEDLEAFCHSILKLPSRAVPELVANALECQKALKRLEKELEAYKARLVQEAQAECRRAGIGDTRETAWNFTAPDGTVARVNFPKDQIPRELGVLRETGAREIAGDFFTKLFAKVWKPAKTFRELVQKMLPPDKAKELVGLIEEESSPRVSFEAAQPGTLGTAMEERLLEAKES